MEDETEFDNNSTIGQLILKVNKLCKKPQIDEKLSDALDTFQDKVSRQKTYLKNGIFNINFAEAALFLQSCAQLYGKKVDLFWDQILEYHTRLIEYDCRDQQEKGKKLDNNVIQQLEERRNRFKRKKKFKLAMEETDSRLYDYLFDKNAPEVEKPSAIEPNNDLYKLWKKVEVESSKITKIPRAVLIQQRRTYRMKNYYIMKNNDFELYDLDDGEFNTMYSRIPGWHVINHLFEYNTLGLLPDKNNTIATLRLCCYLRAQFMTEKNIPFNAPYNEYKEEYLAFKKKFFESESKKWQNMPLDTMADLRKQLDYLAKKEREEEKDDSHKKMLNIPPFVHKDGCSYEGCSECSSEDNKSIITISDSFDKEFDDTFLKGEYRKCGAYESSVEKLSPCILMHDSGFCECEDNTMINSALLETSLVEGSEKEITDKSDSTQNASETLHDKTLADKEKVDSDTPADKSATNDKVDQTPDVQNGEKNPELNDSAISAEENGLPETTESNKAADTPMEVSVPAENLENNLSTNNANEITPNEDPVDDDDNFDTRSIMSDHDYCQAPDTRSLTGKEARKNGSNKSDMVPMSTVSKIVPKFVSLKIPKENKNKDNTLMGPPPPKIRKLSQKQVQKLMKSLIKPVKESKFDNFFSMNYRPQLGEGEIEIVDYNSDNEEFTPEDVLLPDEDVRSIVADHSYCQLPEEPEPTINDSGFVEQTLSQESGVTERQEDDDNDSGAEFPPDLDLPEEEDKPVDPKDQAEYERLLAQLRDSRRQRGEELEIDPERVVTERQKKEQDRLAARARVQQWRETITPILSNLSEKDFDIHEYGSKVMDGMEVEETKPFKTIVEGKTASEVVRYFIASLQLANTYNIEIRGAKKGELSNDTFNVKLLKKDRYHEHLAAYHAPSENDFHKKLKRLREMQSQQTEGNEEEEEEILPVSKRRRKENLNKRQRRSRTPLSETQDQSVFNIQPSYGSPIKLFKNSSNNPPNPIKGKNIVACSVPLTNIDVDAPSTSRSSFVISTPSTSQSFCDELASWQSAHPENFSTPHSLRPYRSKVHLDFE